jgi:drug/metabolite transporter (DMT)-like permease
MTAVLGGLGAAAAWALSAVCSSRSGRMIGAPAVVGWVMIVGLVLAAPLALVHGVPRALGGPPGVWLAVSGGANVIGLVFMFGALRVGQVALVAPLISVEGAVAAVIAVLAGETLAPGVAVTLTVIVAGIIVASIPGRQTAGASQPAHSRAVIFAAAAALMFGGSLYATARAGQGLPVAWVALAARLIGVPALAVPLALAGRLSLTRRAIPLLVTSGICEVLGFYSYTAGSRHGVAVAAVLASQSGTLAGLAGLALFRERLSRRQLIGVTVVVIGVGVLSALHT